MRSVLASDQCDCSIGLSLYFQTLLTHVNDVGGEEEAVPGCERVLLDIVKAVM